MTQQFLRAAQLIVADQLTGIDLSQLHFKFSIRQWDLQTPNTCQIRVFNVANSTAQRVQKEFTSVILNCGYEGADLGTVFSGTLVQARRGRESPVDTYLDISGADGDAELNFNVIKVSRAAGSTYRDRIDLLAQALGLRVGYVAPMPPGTLPRGWTPLGLARDHLRDLTFSTDTTYFVSNGVLNIIPREGYLPGEAVVLTSATGLIGMPEQTEAGIQVKSLLNPQLKTGGLVKIDNASILQAQLGLGLSGVEQNYFLPSIADNDGLYRIVTLEHSGDTRGTEWYSDLICIEIGTNPPPALLARGYT